MVIMRLAELRHHPENRLSGQVEKKIEKDQYPSTLCETQQRVEDLGETFDVTIQNTL
jgi:hypothetical protein